MCVLKWALRCELLVYTLSHPEKWHTCVRLLAEDTPLELIYVPWPDVTSLFTGLADTCTFAILDFCRYGLLFPFCRGAIEAKATSAPLRLFNPTGNEFLENMSLLTWIGEVTHFGSIRANLLGPLAVSWVLQKRYETIRIDNGAKQNLC